MMTRSTIGPETLKNGSGGGIDETDSEKNRYSDTELFKEPASGELRPARKFHSKSFSLSENRIVGGPPGTNVFQQNRELWEKRVELSSQQSLTTSRILTRNRIAPDLVMDLPLTSNESSARSSRDSLEGSGGEQEDMTSAERFAQNQSTLKKNERFSADCQQYETTKKEVKLDMKPAIEKPKAEVSPQQQYVLKEIDDAEEGNHEVDDVVMSSLVAAAGTSVCDTRLDDILHISEDENSCGGGVEKSGIFKEPHKSPIPLRNTQKYVSQFADLHLTGGCLTKSETTKTTSVSTSNLSCTNQPLSLSSFKPQVKVKPQILKKPMVLPPTTPEMTRKSTDH